MTEFSLDVQIEVNGSFIKAGKIFGTDCSDAVFQYDKNYAVEPESRPISISLPLQEESFSSDETRNYFEGLLLRKGLQKQWIMFRQRFMIPAPMKCR